jgi:hypothetical protein
MGRKREKETVGLAQLFASAMSNRSQKGENMKWVPIERGEKMGKRWGFEGE